MNLFDVYPRFDIRLAKGSGIYLYDENGQRYLDLYGGHGVISIGHSHPSYVKALKSQMDQLIFYSNSVHLPIQEALAHKLGELSGYQQHSVFYCNSGAEANENALKVASFHNGKERFIAFKGSFHGRTSAALAVTDNPNLSAPLNAAHFPVTFLELNDSDALKTELEKGDVCGVIVEGIQGVGGLDMPTDAFLVQLRAWCTEYDAVLILDEIQSGCGRTGKFFAHQSAGIQADVVTMAKGLGNGFPIGAVLISETIAPKYGMLGTTFGGNPLACAAALSVLETLESEQLMANASALEMTFRAEFVDVDHVRIKGKGLMLGVELPSGIKEIRGKLLSEHFMFTGNSANPNLLRILPPLSIDRAAVIEFCTALKSLI
ncbi:aspartate aminotransferase family protein [Phaeocystidibacter marisrubri]|uniref:Aminotransferase class III-fold pyridoxal phosphate-dependent enzyme n=1 Tax=Phaeocystidibacter marisrubri TaxID=1577780 RepID=A0A6L3ZKM2_9FLAO|nr:aminotransferase class III-fold pyridoxal phosphate-dependent enzyme [Phaeocystidibacter marisrubri]KAB2818098.1 aminotransferase class III-fold pyridoxal phosphate-dependent enzyme [Phaeocystidibacter marisrubri]GGH71960.1 acetylornithine aminotransferase [Phaeocystidibacter marisrubri]